LYCDPDAEYLSFPSIFCGQRRADNKERSVHVQYTDIVKWELRSMDRQVAQSVHFKKSSPLKLLSPVKIWALSGLK
jgi:hypothetical protein